MTEIGVSARVARFAYCAVYAFEVKSFVPRATQDPMNSHLSTLLELPCGAFC